MPVFRRKKKKLTVNTGILNTDVSQTRHVQDFEVQQALEKILEAADLTVLTRKEVRRQLEKKFGGSFSTPEWKAKIKQQIEQFVQRQESGINTHSGPHTTTNTPSNSNGNGTSSRNRSDRPFTSRGSTIVGPPPKKRRVNGNGSGSGDETYYPSSHRSQLRNARNGNDNVYNNNDGSYYDDRRRPRLQSNKQLIQKSDKDNSYFIKLPGLGAQKRCVMSHWKGKLYVGFREYYEKPNGDTCPTKKGVNLNQEQWEFVIRNIDEINNQLKRMRR